MKLGGQFFRYSSTVEVLRSVSGKTEFRDVAIEAIYNLTDPNTTPFGSAIYGEIKGSDDFIELEAKLLLQKNLSAWMLVYNIGGETAWEDDYQNDEAELMQSAGVSYQLHQAKYAKCHAFENLADYGADALTHEIMPVMARKSKLEPADAAAVLAYLLAVRKLPPP